MKDWFIGVERRTRLCFFVLFLGMADTEVCRSNAVQKGRLAAWIRV